MTSLKAILSAERARLVPSQKELAALADSVRSCVRFLKKAVKNYDARAQVFIGGSYAKKTLLRKTPYEADIFIRFSPQLENQSEILEKMVKKLTSSFSWTYTRHHGSRDYFKVRPIQESLILELIPVTRIRSPRDEKNVTDLSYFHVGYVKKKLGALKEDVLLAKQFCQAQGIYGAESYINGFSGYGLECLIMHYRGFLPLLKAFGKTNPELFIDPEKHYRSKEEALLTLNESKRNGPVVLIDPTYPERNVLAAVSEESFKRFRNAASRFLVRPNASFFALQTPNSAMFRTLALKKKAEYLSFSLETDRQEGDIAGTKLKKGYRYLIRMFSSRYDFIAHEFLYGGEKEATVFFVVKPKSQIILRGPPTSMSEHALAFKRKHRSTFVKQDMLYARETFSMKPSLFLEECAKDTALSQIGITRCRLS